MSHIVCLTSYHLPHDKEDIENKKKKKNLFFSLGKIKIELFQKYQVSSLRTLDRAESIRTKSCPASI
jgi:hypothetical protein